MPTQSNKHANVQRVVYPGFSGGLNLSVSSENLAKTELKEAKNVEFSTRTGSMRVRGGLVWSGKFANTVGDVFPISGRNGFLVRPADSLKWNETEYFRWNNLWPVAGDKLDGAGCPSAVTWEDKDGNDCWLMACGDGLYKFSESPLPTLEKLSGPMEIVSEIKDSAGKTIGFVYKSTKCHQVFLHNGRVGVVGDNDTIYFSAVGDCESDGAWDTDDKDESSAQWIQVGYKDGMDIRAVVPLSKDIIIFKSPLNEPDKGIIYRLVGEPPNWQVVEAARNTGTFSQRSVCVVGNEVYYATPVGIATLSNVVSYGEVKTGWTDRKVSNALVPKLDSTARIYDVPVKQQLWITPYKDSKEMWVYDYGHGIWTTFEYPDVVTYAFGVEDRLFVFMRDAIYEVADDYEQDELSPGTTQDINARMKLGVLQSGMQTLIKGVYASFELRPQCSAVLKLGKFEFPFMYAGDVEYIYDPPNDTQYASDDDDPLFPDGGVLTARRRCIVREWMFEPVIEITGGGCGVSNIALEVVDV